ncbi:MAG: single-stranded DNA-binding protein [Candidatus Paceibacterota bacterium]
MINRTVLIGRMTKDPELKYTSNSNIPVISFTLAVSRPFQSKDSGNNQTADFINCTAWRKTAENASKYTQKGSLIAVEGRLQTRDYTDEKTKTKHYITEVVCDSIVYLDPKSSQQSTNNNQESIEEEKPNIIQDDLPF